MFIYFQKTFFPVTVLEVIIYYITCWSDCYNDLILENITVTEPTEILINQPNLVTVDDKEKTPINSYRL